MVDNVPLCSYSTTNKIHLLSQIILVKRSTCFGLSVHHQELKTAYTATVYVKQLLLPAAIGDEMDLMNSVSSPIAVTSSTCLTYTVAVYVSLTASVV